MRKVINRAGDSIGSVKITPDKLNTKKLTPKERLLYVIAVFSGLGLFATILGCLSLIFVFTAFSSTLPSPTQLTNRTIDQSTKIFDRNGELLYSVFSDKDRTLIELSDVSPHLLDATLAIEDSDFYAHQGLDFLGILRSVYINISGQGKQGGSTLTQQVAKNALLTADRTFTRKAKDIVLALQIENSYSKDDILQMYLNEVPYGGTTWGAEAAAKTYFGKSARDLTLAEAALIAGLPQRPTYYSPFRDPEAAKNRQLRVLKLMYERGWIDKNGQKKTITEEEYEWAVEEPLKFAQNIGVLNAPHFVMYVLDILTERYGEDLVQSGGLQVKTTLDLSLQREYQKIVNEEVEKAKSLDVGNAGLVAIDPQTREVLSMVGSIDYYSKEIDGQFNVTLGSRQPGSTLKPIIYLSALNQGYTASTVLYDVFTSFKRDQYSSPYEPKNYGGWGFRGPMQLRYALANSVNTTAVKTLDLVGIENMVRTANSLGLNFKYDPSKHWLAISLGGGEVRLLDLTNTFASLGSGGKYKAVNPILEVRDYKGNVLEREINAGGSQVVDERNVWIISDILSDNAARTPAFGGNSQLNIRGHKVAVKTGTSNDLKDNWTVGYTRDITIGVWVGNNDGTQMNNRLASGLTGAAPIWNRAMMHFLADNPHPEFPKPEGLVDAWVGTLSGMQPYEDKEDRRIEYFVKGTEPKTKSDMFQRVKICRKGDVKDETYTVYKAEKPEWQSYVESWVRGKYKDDEKEMYLHLDPKYEEEKDKDKFDIDNCDDDDDD